MKMTKRALSIVLAAMMIVSMFVVGAVSVSAVGEVAEIAVVGEGATGVVGDQFTTVNDAVAAAGEGGEVKLIADIYIAAGELNVGIDGDYTTTLNLNGHKITNEAGSCITLYSKYPGGKTFTIKGSGTLTCTPKYPGDACVSDSSGRNVVIKGGTYTNTAGKNALYVSSDEGWTISGGTYNGNIMVKSDLTMTAGTVNGDIVADGSQTYDFDDQWNLITLTDPGEVAISGGTVNGEVVANYDNPITVTGGTFAGDVSEYVDTTAAPIEFTAKNGKVSYPKSLNSLSDGTYKLLADFTQSARMVPGTFTNDVTIDLNGFTLTSTANDYGVLLSRAGSASSPRTFTMKNGTFNAKQGIDALNNYNDVTVEDVTMNVSDNFAICTNGTYSNNNITVKDSDITSGSVAIYKPSSGSLTIENSDVTGTTAVYVKSGDVTIDGGTFTGTGAAADYTYNGNGCNPTGDAVVIENAGSAYAPLGTVAINGGTFDSNNANGILAPAKDGYDEPTGFIYGGSFKGDVDNSYVAPGLVDVASTGGMFVVEPFVIGGKADIDFYQRKVDSGSPESVADDGNDINTKGVRIATKVDQDWLDEYADEYGYVVAKYEGNKTQSELDFSKLTADGGNGQKVIDCTGTVNQNITGISDSVDDYVTLAVNGMQDGTKVVARFYVVVNGVTYYANYTSTAVFDGILATY